MNETEKEFRQLFEKISTDLNRIATVLEAGWKGIEWIIPLAVLLGLVVLAVSGVKAIVRWQQVSAGSHCVVARDDVFGVAELQIKTDLEKELETKDDIGVQDLISKGKAFPLPRQTKCLVLDSTEASDSDSKDLFPKDLFDFSFYRKIRVLSGDYHGKAVWIPNSVLRTDTGTDVGGGGKPEDPLTASRKSKIHFGEEGELIMDLRDRKPGEPVPQKIISDEDKQAMLETGREAILHVHPATNIDTRDYFITVMSEWYDVKLPVSYGAVTYLSERCTVRLRKTGQRWTGEVISFPTGLTEKP